MLGGRCSSNVEQWRVTAMAKLTDNRFEEEQHVHTHTHTHTHTNSHIDCICAHTHMQSGSTTMAFSDCASVVS